MKQVKLWWQVGQLISLSGINTLDRIWCLPFLLLIGNVESVNSSFIPRGVRDEILISTVYQQFTNRSQKSALHTDNFFWYNSKQSISSFRKKVHGSCNCSADKCWIPKTTKNATCRFSEKYRIGSHQSVGDISLEVDGEKVLLRKFQANRCSSGVI